MVQLDKHQIDAIRTLKSGNILVGGVGTGKTRTAIAWWLFKVCKGQNQIVTKNTDGGFSRIGKDLPMETPTDLYVITTARKRDSKDWELELTYFSETSQARVVIDSWNNIHKYEHVRDACFLFDEQRVVGYGSWVQSFLRIAKQNTWLLLSATPGDTWTDYIPVFIANGFYKNKTQFVDRHAVWDRYSKYPKIKRFVDENILYGLKRRITVDMEVPRHTVRHFNYIPVAYDRKTVEEVITEQRWNPYTEKPIKDVSEYCALLKRVIFADPSRLDATRKIIADHPRVIIFYSYDFELDQIRKLKDLCLEGFDYAEWNGHIHENVPTSQKWIYVVNYMAGSEAWNCITTDTVIFWSQNYSYKQMEQSCGRIDRMNTPYIDLNYYILRSRSGLDLAISRSLRQKKKFNETKYYSQFWDHLTYDSRKKQLSL